tara:strand:+ start:1280 stop:1921 length:642 start_codon:yes stop_codon:yes gene_type:complete
MTQQADGDKPGDNKPDEDKTEPQGGDPTRATATATDEKTLPQAEVDRIVGKVRAEERAKYADYEEKSEELERLKTANLSESERKEQQYATAQRAAAEAGTRVSEAHIVAEIRVQAATQGLVDPDAVLAMIDRTGITYTEGEGVKGVTEAMGVLLDAKPYLKGSGPSPTNVNPGGSATKPVTLTAEERRTAHVMFKNLPAAEAEAEYAKGKRNS